ncbi:TPA: hypothetical protein KEV35_004604 [Escherichia coli]|nr:hypothetical protein [Escherichia coli]
MVCNKLPRYVMKLHEDDFFDDLAGISSGGMYCPEYGTVHWPDGVTPSF